jgi:thiol-disulfide isomerase/thioredoxin
MLHINTFLNVGFLLIIPILLLACHNDTKPVFQHSSGKTTIIIRSEVERPDTIFISARGLAMTPKITFFERDIEVKKEYSSPKSDTFLIDVSATEMISIRFGNTIMYEIPVIAQDTLKITIDAKRATGNYVKNSTAVDKIFWFVNQYIPSESMNLNYDAFFDKIAKKFFVEKQSNYTGVYQEEKTKYISLKSKLDSLAEHKIISEQVKNLLIINFQSRLGGIMTINHIKNLVSSDTSMSYLTRPFLGNEVKPIQDSYFEFYKYYMGAQLSERITTGPFKVINFPKLFDYTTEQSPFNKSLQARLLLWEMENIFEYFPEATIFTYFEKFQKLASEDQVVYLKKANIWLEYKGEKDVISVYDIAGQKTYLSERLKSNKIKYIDFWASWCGPCLSEMTHSKKLEKTFESQVDFIYISIDKNFNQWQYAMEKLGLNKANHHFLLPTTKNMISFMGQNIVGIPRYMIIDNRGQVIRKNAPRPSDPLTVKLLLGLVKK